MTNEKLFLSFPLAKKKKNKFYKLNENSLR